MLSPSVPWCNEFRVIVGVPEISWKCRAECKVCWLAKLHQSASCYFDTNETPFLHPAVKTAYLAPTYSVTHWLVKLFMLWYCEDGLDHLSITNIYFDPGVTGSSCTPYRLLIYAIHQHDYMWLIRNCLEALHRFESDAPFTISSPNSTWPWILQAPSKAIHAEAHGLQDILLISSFASLNPAMIA